MYYLLLQDLSSRNRLIEKLKESGIGAVFHYVPLHSSPAGRKYGTIYGDLLFTQEMSSRLVRLPLWLGLESSLDGVIKLVIREVES